MDQLAKSRGVTVRPGKTGKLYRATPTNAWGVGVYASGRGFEIDLAGLRDDGGVVLADSIQSILSHLSGKAQPARFPSVSCQCVLDHWERVQHDVLEPYFGCRAGASAAG